MNITKILQRSCPICGFNTGEVLHRQRFILPESHPLENGYDVVTCRTCGFAFADTTVPQNAYDEYYTRLSKYDDVAISTGGSGNPSDTARLDDTAMTLAKLLPRNARILDIGCAGGGLMNSLKKQGFAHLVGLDPSLACVNYAKSEFDLEMHQGIFRDAPELGKFDVILLSHVLEHVEDIKNALHFVRNTLTEDGSIYVEVPDAMRYVDYLAAPFQDFNTEHINHFSAQSLKNLAAISGFSVKYGDHKIIEATTNVPYPAIWQLWKKNKLLTVTNFDKTCDLTLQLALKKYISASQKMLDQMNARLQLALQGKIVVWGTGQLAMKLLADTVLGESKIAFWIDSNPILHGHLLHGAKVLSPEKGAAHLRNKPMPIVIASTIHSVSIKKLIENDLMLNVPIIVLC